MGRTADRRGNDVARADPACRHNDPRTKPAENRRWFRGFRQSVHGGLAVRRFLLDHSSPALVAWLGDERQFDTIQIEDFRCS